MDSQETDEPASPYAVGLNDKFAALYEELRQRAIYEVRKWGHANLSPTTLLHQAWLKMKDTRALSAGSDLHFKAIAARAMRQVLVDEARKRFALKRGENTHHMRITLCAEAETTTLSEAELLDLNTALDELHAVNYRQAEIVEKHFFGGLSLPEIAQILELSVSSVERDWRVARAWLRHRLRPDS